MTNLSFDYHNLHTQIPPDENAKRLEIVAEIIRINQQRSIGVTLTEALGNKLIYDLENGIITAEEVNK